MGKVLFEKLDALLAGTLLSWKDGVLWPGLGHCSLCHVARFSSYLDYYFFFTGQHVLMFTKMFGCLLKCLDVY